MLYNVLHPCEAIDKIRWKISRRRLHSCGIRSSMGVDFTIRGAEYISIGDNSHCGRHNILAAYSNYQGQETGYIPRLIIGNNVSMMDNCQISCANGIEIGDGTLLGDNVFITDNFHGSNTLEEMAIPPLDRPLGIKNSVKVGKNVWIGRNVCIMPGVQVGDGAVIGANAVVTKSVPAKSIAVGVPAKIITKNNDEIE